MVYRIDDPLFLDSEALVINKPSGLAVDPPRSGDPSVADMAETLTFGFMRPPSAVHRLDRDTSGCLLMARNPKSHKRFSMAFEEGRVEKRYIALVDGVPEAEEGVIQLALMKLSSREAGWRMIPAKKGKPAESYWKRLGVIDGMAVLLFLPTTGRTHQLRVHAASGLGYAISGDPVYGAGKGPMMLHAISLFVGRNNKPAIEATAPLPPHFLKAGISEEMIAGFADMLGHVSIDREAIAAALPQFDEDEPAQDASSDA